jgi:hypothetical protein
MTPPPSTLHPQDDEWLDQILTPLDRLDGVMQHGKQRSQAKRAILAELHKREAAARVDELGKLTDSTAPLIKGETWKDWAYRVSDYLKARLAKLQQPKQEGHEH